MKLKKFNAKTINPQPERESYIRVHQSGRITLSIGVTKKLNLDDSSRISILQDEEEPKDWYLIKDEDGFELRKKKGENTYRITSSCVAKTFLNSLELSDTASIKCKVAAESEVVTDPDLGELEVYAIITAAAIQSN